MQARGVGCWWIADDRILPNPDVLVRMHLPRSMRVTARFDFCRNDGEASVPHASLECVLWTEREHVIAIVRCRVSVLLRAGERNFITSTDFQRFNL